MKQILLAGCFAAALTMLLFVPQEAFAATCPKNCVSWYDGCNTCSCVNGQVRICTKRYCKKKGRAYCKKKKPSCPTCSVMRCSSGYTCKNIAGCGKCIKKLKPRPTRCPKNCVSWYDGCNTCRCVNGRIKGCTKRACKRYTRPYCKKKKRRCPKCSTMRCRSGYTCKNIKGCGKCIKKPKPGPKACPGNCAVWYDGCNTCTCAKGRIVACTKRACIRRGRAYCKKKR